MYFLSLDKNDRYLLTDADTGETVQLPYKLTKTCGAYYRAWMYATADGTHLYLWGNTNSVWQVSLDGKHAYDFLTQQTVTCMAEVTIDTYGIRIVGENVYIVSPSGITRINMTTHAVDRVYKRPPHSYMFGTHVGDDDVVYISKYRHTSKGYIARTNEDAELSLRVDAGGVVHMYFTIETAIEGDEQYVTSYGNPRITVHDGVIYHNNDGYTSRWRMHTDATVTPMAPLYGNLPDERIMSNGLFALADEHAKSGAYIYICDTRCGARYQIPIDQYKSVYLLSQ